MKNFVLYELTEIYACVYVFTDSGSSVRSGSPALSRLVPGHRLWADRHGRHVLGLIEDYSALSKQIREAKRITATMDKQLQERVRTYKLTNFNNPTASFGLQQIF